MMKRHLPVLALALLLGLLVFLLDVHVAGQRGLLGAKNGEWLYGDVIAANQAYASGKLPVTAFYPPLLMLLMLGLRHLGVATIDMAVFNGVMTLGGFVALYAIAFRLLRDVYQAGAVVVLAILNPYVLWTFLINKDTASELFFMALTLYAFLAAWDRQQAVPPVAPAKRWTGVLAAALCCILLMLTRTTGFYIGLALLLTVAFLNRAGQPRRAWSVGVAGFLAAACVFCAINKARVGAFTLSTSSGVNLYLGNHPNYLDGHPKYDIDVFLPDLAVPPRDEAAADAINRKAAVRFIREDPLAFVYRLIVKSEWYWFTLEKTPNFTALTTLDVEHQTVHLGKIDHKPGVAYLLYRLVYMPYFLLALWLLWSGRLDRRFVLLAIPLLVIWPITAMTFPDTRFKMNAELMMLPAVVAAWKTGRVQSFLLRRHARSPEHR